MSGRGQLTDERRDDWPQVVIRPAETNNNEELPLVPSHTNFLNLLTGQYSITCGYLETRTA